MKKIALNVKSFETRHFDVEFPAREKENFPEADRGRGKKSSFACLMKKIAEEKKEDTKKFL